MIIWQLYDSAIAGGLVLQQDNATLHLRQVEPWGEEGGRTDLDSSQTLLQRLWPLHMQVTHILSCCRGEGKGGNNFRNTSSRHFLHSTTAVDIYKLWAIALTNAGCHQTRVQETFGACMTYNSLGKRKMTLQFAVFAHAESLCKCSWACKQMMPRKVLWLGTFSQMFTFCSQRTLKVFGQK